MFVAHADYKKNVSPVKNMKNQNYLIEAIRKKNCSEERKLAHGKLAHRIHVD